MKYTIAKLASAAGVSVRTLHYYDEIGLLVPAGHDGDNGYRYYGEAELLRLQQIMFFRELEFPLAKIKEIMGSPSFSNLDALVEHRQVLLSQKNRLNKLIKTIDLTINSLKKGQSMTANDLYEGFDKAQMEEYQQEAQERWGDTDAYKQSVARVAKMGKVGLAKVVAEGKEIEVELAKYISEPVESKNVQEIVARHRKHISNFYDVSDEMYRGLAEMYIADPRFTKHYDDVVPGLTQFLHDAIVFSLEK
jgi:DNA-binding transcriptional MerR regulator